MYTRDEFETLRRQSAQAMARDQELRGQALAVKVRAGHEYYWVHQTNWMGEPCLQLAQDMFALQEAVYNARPDVIIECGVAWGGTVLFLASLLKLFGGQKVIGIDVYIPPDLRERIATKVPFPGAIELIEGSSIDPATAAIVREKIGADQRVMVILDSNHTHDHVLQELKLYAPMVSVGSYLICGDTIIEEQPPAEKRPRAWGKGNNPATALREFLAGDDQFEVDHSIEDKLLLSNMPGGYLRRRGVTTNAS
jgi:cephalosporin hydroxylase